VTAGRGRPRVRIAVEPQASESDRQAVRDHLDAYNVGVTGLSDYHSLAIMLRAAHGEIRGGLLGTIWGGWLHVAYLWVAEPLRRHGFGARLVRAAERYAVEQGCRAAWLDTFSFQAPGFYRKLGYQRFATLADHPPGQAHHFLWKRLARRRLAGRRRPRP
jgi:ribosomal protein S18 acetylase RimI-like enzyme